MDDMLWPFGQGLFRNRHESPNLYSFPIHWNPLVPKFINNTLPSMLELLNSSATRDQVNDENYEGDHQ